MPREYKRPMCLASLVTLLPILAGLLLWEDLALATSLGLESQSGPGALVFGLPLSMLAGQWLCLLITLRDPKNQGRNQKIIQLVLWLIPVMSNLSSGIAYTLALDTPFSPSSLMMTMMGVLFLVVGNYLPKCRQNHTVGIKLVWTFASEENWNATHRFGGRVWMAGGAALLLFAWIPGAVGMWGAVLSILALVFIPMVYSYVYYRRQKARGDTLTPIDGQKRFGKAFVFTSLILVPALLIFLFVAMFTGRITYSFQENHLDIQASYYSDLRVPYDKIEEVEFIEGNVPGSRIYGVGSLRLLLGSFKSEALRNYTRYTYYAPEACLLLTVNGKPLVLSGESREETLGLYEEILERVESFLSS